MYKYLIIYIYIFIGPILLLYYRVCKNVLHFVIQVGEGHYMQNEVCFSFCDKKAAQVEVGKSVYYLDDSVYEILHS